MQTGNHAYHIDLAAARERGIVIAKASGGFCTGAAELTIGLAIALLRRIPDCDVAVKSGHWQTPMGRELHGKTLGIVGLGRVERRASDSAFCQRIDESGFVHDRPPRRIATSSTRSRYRPVTR